MSARGRVELPAPGLSSSPWRTHRAAHVIERLEAVLAASSEALSRGAILILEEARHRIRYLSIGEPEP
jgi:hypothetical protein